jgi:hypothetical protein
MVRANLGGHKIMIQPKWYRRRALYAALVVGLLAAAIPVSQSLASATSCTATVPIEKNNGDCDFTGTKKVIGEATITHNKDGSVSGKYSIHGASPTRGYFLFLIADSISGIPTPPLCSFVTDLGKFKVDASGDGGKTFTAKPDPRLGDFYVLGFNSDTGQFDRSAVAHV